MFGIIPAAVHSNAVAKVGVPSLRYWTAFAVSFVFGVALWTVLLIILVAGSAAGAVSGLGAVGAVLVPAALITIRVLTETAYDRRARRR